MKDDFQIKRGDLCRLKTGGPVMIFEKVLSSGKDKYCLCSRIKEDQIILNCFYLSQLKFLDTQSPEVGDFI